MASSSGYSRRLPDGVLIKIGLVTAMSAHLESRMTELIAWIATPWSDRQVIEALVEADSFDAKLNKLRMLSSPTGTWNQRPVKLQVNWVCPEPVREDLRAFVALAEKAGLARNEVVHGQWFGSLDDPSELLYRATRGRSKSRIVQETRSTDDLDMHLTLVVQAARMADDLHSRLVLAEIDELSAEHQQGDPPST